MPSLGDAFVDVRADTRKLGRDIDQGVTKAAQGATGQLGGVRKEMAGIGTVAKAAIAGAAVSAVVDLVGSFSNLEQAIGGTEAVFGDASGPIDEFAERAAESIGLAESEFRTATTLIGGQLKRMTGDVDLAAEQSIILTQVGADLAATYGGTTKEAVEALSSAFRGEADPAERFNLNLKIGAVNAKAVELGLARTTSEVDDNARAQATLALILDQSSDAQGQFARETDTVAGQLQILTARMEDFKARAGEELAPAVVELASAATNLFDALDEDVNLGWTQRLSASLQTLLGESEESVAAYIEQKEAANDLADGLVPVADSAEQVALDMARGRDRADEYEQALSETATAAVTAAAGQEELNLELRTGIELTREAFNQNRAQTDALFAVRDATKDVEGAQALLNELVATGQQNTPLYVEAVEDLAEANAVLSDAEIRVREEGLLTRDEFINQQTALGLTREQAELLAAEYDELFKPRSVTNTIRINEVTAGGTTGRTFGGGQASGGSVDPRHFYTVGERGPELFVPDMPGTIIPNSNITTGGINATVNVTVGAGVSRADGMMVGVEVERALRRLAESRTVA